MINEIESLFVIVYKEERVKENYFVNIIFPCLKLIPSSRLSILTFVEHNPFGGVNNIIEVDAMSWHYFKNVAMNVTSNFVHMNGHEKQGIISIELV